MLSFHRYSKGKVIAGIKPVDEKPQLQLSRRDSNPDLWTFLSWPRALPPRLLIHVTTKHNGLFDTKCKQKKEYYTIIPTKLQKYLVRPHRFSCPPTPKKIMQTTKGVAWTCTTTTRKVAWTLNKLARNVYLFLSLPAAQRNHKLQQSDFRQVQNFKLFQRNFF